MARSRNTNSCVPDDFYGPPGKIGEPEELASPIRWQEEGDEECCVETLSARELAISPDQEFEGSNGEYLKGVRTIRFRLKMGRPQDAQMVQVIQYSANDVIATSDGQRDPPPMPAVQGTNWRWSPGDDGWMVDSVDNVRCWPEYSETEDHGLQRDPATGVVEWSDNPGISLDLVLAAVQNGQYDTRQFPLTIESDFKTDILCSEEDLCVPESPAARQALEQHWIADVVARVTWHFELVVRGGNFAIGWRPFIKATAPPRITNISESIFKPCDAEGF